MSRLLSSHRNCPHRSGESQQILRPEGSADFSEGRKAWCRRPIWPEVRRVDRNLDGQRCLQHDGLAGRFCDLAGVESAVASQPGSKRPGAIFCDASGIRILRDWLTGWTLCRPFGPRGARVPLYQALRPSLKSAGPSDLVPGGKPKPQNCPGSISGMSGPNGLRLRSATPAGVESDMASQPRVEATRGYSL